MKTSQSHVVCPIPNMKLFYLKMVFPETKIQRQPLPKEVYGAGSEKEMTVIISV